MSALPQRWGGPGRRGTPAARAGRPPLHLVAPPSTWVRRLVAAVVVAALGVLGIVALNAYAAQYAIEARELEAEVGELSLEVEQLTAEVAELQAPAHVRERARKLGLVDATGERYLAPSLGYGAVRNTP